MRYRILRGFSLGGGIDVQPGETATIPEKVQYLVPLWQKQGKLGEEVADEPTMVHRGAGRWDVLNAAGVVVKSGIKKAEAEKEVAWLNKQE